MGEFFADDERGFPQFYLPVAITARNGIYQVELN